MKFRPTLLSAVLALAALAPTVHAAPGTDILKSQCVSCHSISKPEDVPAEKLLDRKGPDLQYSGVKFNKEWLTGWLQNPTVIRQGGAMYARSVKPGSGGAPDTIDAAQVSAHPKLAAADAAAVVDALMALGAGEGLVQKGAFKQEPPNSMASLLFNKLRGCASCHSAKPGTGGVSGPELYTAGERLQPDYVVEYIRNPQKFDAHVWMPKLDLNDGDIQKLTGYLTTLKQGGAK